MAKIYVSVIVPVYNTIHYLDDCMNSILNQSLREIEVLCIDDGSTDGSRDKLLEYAKKDERVKVIVPGGNHGQAYARNRGVEVASGQYIMYVDSDDMLMEQDTIKKLYNEANREKIDVLVFGADATYEIKRPNDPTFILKQEHYEEGVVDGETYIIDAITYDELKPNVWTKLWRREFLIENNVIFREETAPHEDLLYVFEAIVFAKRVKYLDEICYLYRWREGSSTSEDFSPKRLYAYITIFSYMIEFIKNVPMHYDTVWYINLYFKATQEMVRILTIDAIKNQSGFNKTLFNNNFHKLLLDEMMLSGYHFIKRPLLSKEYFELSKSKTIYVYGVGSVGQEIIRMLNEYELDFQPIVTKLESNQSIDGKKVLEFDKVDKNKDDIFIVAVANRDVRNEITQKIKAEYDYQIISFLD